MGGTRLTEHLRFVYGLLEDRTAYRTAYSTDRKLSGGKLWWNLVDSRDLPNSARVVESTNHDFPSPGWKIAIGSLSTSALAALKNLTCDQFGAPFGRQPRRHLGGDFLCIFFCVLRFY